MLRFRRKAIQPKNKKRTKLTDVRINFSKTLGAVLIATGVLLVASTPIYYWYTNIYASNVVADTIDTPSSPIPSADPIQIDGKLQEGEYDEEQLPNKVLIPALSVDVKLKPAKVILGKWEVFEDSGSFGLGSAAPGEMGNSVIFAHARSGLFLPLKNIKNGTEIYVLSQKGWFEYKVEEIKEVLPTDTSVIEQTQDETLTLYTCSGFADSKRLIVTAKRSS